MPSVRPGALQHLFGELARGHENEGPKRARSAAARKPLENRQDERGRLAGAGLGGTDQIATGERQRDGFLLNGGGALVAFFGYGADQLGNQPEGGEWHAAPSYGVEGETSREIRRAAGLEQP